MSKRDTLIGTTVDDRFYIDGYLGEGSFGVVYHAEQRIFGVFYREVALKVFKEGRVNRSTAQETFADAIILARLLDRHRDEVISRHLVQVYDFGILKDLEGCGFVAMEYCWGDLHRRLRNLRGPLPHGEAIDYMQQICQGLTLLHGYRSPQDEPLPIIHRDLKPGNILLTTSGIVKVADFGLATMVDKILRDAADAGTICCQAPESFEAFSNDPRSDIYSLGLIFYEMLTKVQPFEDVGQELAKDQREEYLRVQREARKIFEKAKRPPSDFNPVVKKTAGLDELVMKCLSYYPGDRYQDAMALMAALQNLGEVRGPDGPSTDQKIRQLMDKGKFYLEKGDYPQAITFLEEAWQAAADYRLIEQFPDLSFALGQAYFQTGDHKLAVAKYNEGLKIKKRCRYYTELGKIFRALNRPDLAAVKEKEGIKYPYE